MKVCMVSGAFVPTVGGPVTQMSHLCQALMQAGVDVTVVTFGPETELDTSLGFPVYRVRFDSPRGTVRRKMRWVRFIRALREVLTRERPDVIHCHDAHVHSFLTGMLARLMRVPSIVQYAGSMVWETVNADALRVLDFDRAHRWGTRARLLHVMEKRGLRLFDVVVAGSEFRRAQLSALDVPDRLIRVIPYFIRLPSRPTDAVVDELPTVITAGQMVPRKRLDVLVDAFSRVDVPGARLRIVGEGSPEVMNQLRALTIARGIEERVEITGRVSYDRLIRFMSQATLYASASIEEGFGIVFVEAMALSLPVVAMRIGGIPEVVPDGQAGYLIAPTDREALIDRLRHLLADRPQCKLLGDFGRRYSQRFDLDNHLEVFLDLYRQVSA